MVRMADILPSPLTAITTTLMVFLTLRAWQLLGQKFPGVLLGGIIPSES